MSTQKPVHDLLSIAALFVIAPKLETTQMSFNRWLDKSRSIHATEYYSAVKKLIHNNLDGFQGPCAEWKEPISKGHTLYDSTFLTFSKWQNCSHGEQTGVRDGSLKGMGVTIKEISVVMEQFCVLKWWGGDSVNLYIWWNGMKLYIYFIEKSISCFGHYTIIL